MRLSQTRLNCGGVAAVQVQVSGWGNQTERIWLNRQVVNRSEFEARLLEELKRRPPDCAVAFEGDPDVEFKLAGSVIGTIRGLGAEVVLVPGRKDTLRARQVERGAPGPINRGRP